MYGGRNPSSASRNTPERVPYSPSSVYSDASTARTSSSGGRKAVSAAARSVAGVFVSCFTPPDTGSSTKSLADSDESKAHSGNFTLRNFSAFFLFFFIFPNFIIWVWIFTIRIRKFQSFE